MNRFINHNGILKNSGKLLFDGSHRAFRYGDGLFETIRVFDGKIPFLNHHVERLLKGLKILQFEIPETYQKECFEKEIQKLINNKGNHRIRLSVYRSGGGLYTPENNHPEFLIESNSLKNSKFIATKKGLNLGIYDKTRLCSSSISALKTNNSLPYILAGNFAKKHQFDDCLMLNKGGKFVESISSNLFVIKEKSIYTPFISDGCVAGTMRKLILQIAKEKGFKIKEIKVSLSHLLSANEIWLTNAIQGIRWAKYFEKREYGNNLSVQFINYLNEKIKE